MKIRDSGASSRRERDERYLNRLRALPVSKNSRPYVDSADSDLLRESLRTYTGDLVLEIGFGSGSIMEGLAKRFQVVVGTDLVLGEPLQKPPYSSQMILADRASCFRSSVFDLVVSNPPYLPSGTIEDIAVDGGEGGVEVPLLFLEDALRALKEGGKVVMVLSSSGDIRRFETYCSKRRLDFRVVAERRVFFEVLRVYEVERRANPKRPMASS